MFCFQRKIFGKKLLDHCIYYYLEICLVHLSMCCLRGTSAVRRELLSWRLPWSLALWRLGSVFWRAWESACFRRPFSLLTGRGSLTQMYSSVSQPWWERFAIWLAQFKRVGIWLVQFKRVGIWLVQFKRLPNPSILHQWRAANNPFKSLIVSTQCCWFPIACLVA